MPLQFLNSQGWWSPEERGDGIPTGQSPLVWLLKRTFAQLKNTEKWKNGLCAFCLGDKYVNHMTFHWKARAAGGSVLLGKGLSLLFTEPSFQLSDTGQPCFPQTGARTGAARQGPAQRAFEDHLFPREPHHCWAHLTTHCFPSCSWHSPLLRLPQWVDGQWPSLPQGGKAELFWLLQAVWGARAAHRCVCTVRCPSGSKAQVWSQTDKRQIFHSWQPGKFIHAVT